MPPVTTDPRSLVTLDTSLTPFPLTRTANGAVDIAPAVTGRKYRIRAIVISSAGSEVATATVTAALGGATTTIFQMSTDDQVGAVFVLPGYIECDASTAVQVNLSGNVTNGVMFTIYAEVVGG